MHLSTMHGSSYYSESVNTLAKMSYTPLNTVIRRANAIPPPMDNSDTWKWYLIGAAILALFIGACIGHAYFRSAKRKWSKDRRQRKHAQWYGQQAV
ncbi:hypothetical protein MBLNU13_g04863t1 [Cladosporium sp. NU13]